jgi:hypothetical protein
VKIRVTIPTEPDEQTLGVALEAATRYAQADIARGDIPPLERAIESGLRWRPEPPGEESFDPPSLVISRGWGDCDDLAPWLAAELRESGQDPLARAVAVRSGPDTWHAVVESRGEILDPSAWAGMPGGTGQGAPWTRPLREGRPAVRVGARAVRVDVPGVLAVRGCRLGQATIAPCEPTDEDQVRALLHAIATAVDVGRRARTGDVYALRSLAVLWRLLRGESLEDACAAERISVGDIGLDITAPVVRSWIRTAREIVRAAKDEVCSPQPTVSGVGAACCPSCAAGLPCERCDLPEEQPTVGVAPCLAAVIAVASAAAAIASAATTIIRAIANALAKAAGENTDFGRAMKDLSKASKSIGKVADAADRVIHGRKEKKGKGNGKGGKGKGMHGPEDLLTSAEGKYEGVPADWGEGIQDWIDAIDELRGGHDPTHVVLAYNIYWIESALARTLPPELTELATRYAPQMVDALAPLADQIEALQKLATADAWTRFQHRDLEQQVSATLQSAIQPLLEDPAMDPSILARAYPDAPWGSRGEGVLTEWAKEFFRVLAEHDVPPFHEAQHAARLPRDIVSDIIQAQKTLERLQATTAYAPTTVRAIERAQRRKRAARLAPMIEERTPRPAPQAPPRPAPPTPPVSPAHDARAAAEDVRSRMRRAPTRARIPIGWHPRFAGACSQFGVCQ